MGMAAKGRSDATADHHCIPCDSVDRLLARWAEVRPDLDFAPVAVVARLGRLRSHFDAELEVVFGDHGLSGPAFAVLVSLARLNEPGGVSQRRLMDDLGLTSGTVSVRMDRLVEQGLVERRADPLDRRNARITLSDRGRELYERVVPAHLANERRLLGALTAAEHDLLVDLLRKLLVEFEGSVPPDGAPLRLGLTLAPVHVTLAMRRAVGLPDALGLLLRAVEDSGPAAEAGLRPGDVLLRSGEHDLLSVAGLYAAMADASEGGRLRVRILRGVDERAVTVRLPAVAPDATLALARTAGRTARDLHRV